MHIFKHVARLLSLALLVSVMLTTPNPTSAASTFVVDDDGFATSADCDAGDAADSLTIQGGVDAASVGDTVLVCPGYYQEAVVIDVPGLTLQGVSGSGQPVIDAGQGPSDPPTSAIDILDGFDGVTVDNFFVTGAGPCSGGAGIRVRSDDNTITNNTLVDNLCCGIVLDGSANTEVAYNTIQRSDSDGIRVHNGANGNNVHHNEISRNAAGIELRLSSGNTVTRNNSHHNREDGIFLRADSGPANVVEDNNAHHNADDGIDDNAGNAISEAANHLHHNGDNDCEGCLPQ